MCSLQRNYDVIRNWARFETGPLTVFWSEASPTFIFRVCEQRIEGSGENVQMLKIRLSLGRSYN